jgi:DNA polymerase-3 subunit beta
VSIKCVRDRAVINGLDARDFPPIPNVAKGISATIEITALRQAITQVVFAASSIEARPILTGVEARLEGSTLALAAADGFRLAVYKFTLSQPVDQKVTAIIPAKTLIELNTLMKDQTEPISVTISKSHIIFRLKDIELVSTLINGEFPQYEQLYPQGSSTKVIVNTVKFLQVTKAAAVFARENSNIVRMIITPGGELTPGKLTLLAKANDIGDNQGEIDATVQGGEVKVVFTSRYMSDVLGVLKNAQVSVEIFGSTSPIVIRAVGDENYIHLIMPMFAVWE